MTHDKNLQSAINPSNHRKPSRRVKLDDTSSQRLVVSYKVRNDKTAFDELIEGNQHLVMKTVLEYRRDSGLSTERLIKVGNDGLKDAVEGFDPPLQTDFSVRAVRCIRSRIEDALRGQASLSPYLGHQLTP